MDLLAPATSDPHFRWDKTKARHLVERAGFGVPPSAWDRLAAIPLAQAVDTLVNYQRYPDPYPEPDWLPPPLNQREERLKLQQLPPDERRKAQQERQRAERQALMRLQQWWLDRMRTTPRPLQEKMTLFWHGHFAVSAQKVRQARLNYELNQIFREHATGNFGQLVRAVGKSPAMLEYLDQRQSRKEHPNENWARELFELFTLGVGNYTERDIKEAARAFTGWTSRDGRFVFNARIHDDGRKVIFDRVGNFDGDAVIDLVLKHPACAEFICRKLWTFFAYENPEDDIVKGLSKTLRDSNYEIAPVLRQMFLSRAFYSDKCVGVQIKSPVQYAVELVGQLGVEEERSTRLLPVATAAMGQELFYPPNVKGWDGGRAWITTNSVFVRASLARYLVTGEVPDLPGRGRRAVAQPAEAPGMRPAMMRESMDAAGVAPLSSQDAMSDDDKIEGFILALAGVKAGAHARRPQAPFDAEKFFAAYGDWKVEDLVHALSSYFLAVPLTEKQCEVLDQVVKLHTSPRQGGAVHVRDLSEETLRALVYLLVTSAEYQLC
jgi:hypothetical protein